ncbi:hypothetical protein [Azospirillum argentinense]|nr:hypothetical protein [Azospirillum argentinense]
MIAITMSIDNGIRFGTGPVRSMDVRRHLRQPDHPHNVQGEITAAS